MDGFAMEKVAGGKLLIVKTDHGTHLDEVHIQGDFFAHPEEAIDHIEKELRGLKIDFDESEVDERLEKLIEENGYNIIGFDTEDLIRVLKRAVSR
jgi:hypothetical protein